MAKDLEAKKEDQNNDSFPKSVYLIIGNEFCERFSFYGMKAVLAIYLSSKLHFSEDTTTMIYHGFVFLCYFTPIFGAIIADSFLGKFRTIFYISLIYVLGHALKTVATIPPLNLPPVELSLLGLALIAFGTGGIKPCVAAFGGDQFKLPEQEKALTRFFSFFYVAINLGSLISIFLTPMLRKDVHCFGEKTCYSLAFGIPALLMLVATIIFVAGKPFYKMNPPAGNILVDVVKSISRATAKSMSSNKEKVEHWLDRARDKFSESLIEDIKVLLRILILYIPLPIFWALFDQQGSRWTFQATRMDGLLFSGFYIKPDQIQTLNPLLIITLIPLFNYVIYPLFEKVNFLVEPVHRIIAGGLLMALAFVASGLLEQNLAYTYAQIPAEGKSALHVMNGSPCNAKIIATSQSLDYSVNSSKDRVFYLESGEVDTKIEISGPTCVKKIFNITLNLKSTETSGLLLHGNGNELSLSTMDLDPRKDKEGFNLIKIFSAENTTWSFIKDPEDILNITIGLKIDDGLWTSSYAKLEPGAYTVKDEGTDKLVGKLEILKQGGVMQMHSGNRGSVNTLLQYTLTRPNTIHILWQVPQYVLITVGEILFSITGLEFSYSKAPGSMKSVIQAAWLLTTALGNVIVIIVAEVKLMNQMSEFFMFAALMVVDIGLFALLAYRFNFVGNGNKSKKKGDYDLKEFESSSL